VTVPALSRDGSGPSNRPLCHRSLKRFGLRPLNMITASRWRALGLGSHVRPMATWGRGAHNITYGRRELAAALGSTKSTLWDALGVSRLVSTPSSRGLHTFTPMFVQTYLQTACQGRRSGRVPTLSPRGPRLWVMGLWLSLHNTPWCHDRYACQVARKLPRCNVLPSVCLGADTHAVTWACGHLHASFTWRLTR
jgi:hypothetical protein